MRLLLALAWSACAFAGAGDYNLYVGTYTGPTSKGIYAFHYDAAKGKASPLGVAAEMPRPSFLAFSPDAGTLYAVSEVGNSGKEEGAVYAFRVDPSSGKLTFLNQQPSGGGGACHLVVTKNAKTLLVANYGSGSVASFALKPDGSIGDRVSKIQYEGSGPNPARQRGPHAHAVVLSPDNRFVFVPDLGTDRVNILRLNASTGELTRNTPEYAAVKPGSGPRHFAFSPDGRFAFLLCEMGSQVVAFRYDAKSGALSEVDAQSTLPEGFNGVNNCAEIEVDKNHHVYASNRGSDSIALFSYDQSTGKLTKLAVEPTQTKTPRHFAIDPTGNHLLAAGQDSAKVVVFRRDRESGKLTPAGDSFEAPSPVCLLFSTARR